MTTIVQPLVSIIIVNYNGKNLLEKCLTSINKTTYTNYEIIVVDNNSSDCSLEFINKNYPQIQTIKLNKNYGFASPNNIAAKITKGKYLVFLNNDIIVTPSWLGELVTTLENDASVVMAQSLLMKPDGNVDSSGDFIDDLGRAYSNHDIPKTIRYILSPRAACMIIKRDVFLDLGGFDESYFASFEDVELGWKSWLWGFKAVVVPTSIVYHKGGQTIKEIPDIVSFHGIKNNIMLRLTNFEFLESIKSLLLIAIIIFTKKVLRISLVKDMDQRFNIPDLKTIFKACIWILRNYTQINRKRSIIKSRKIRTNQELKKLGLITTFSW